MSSEDSGPRGFLIFFFVLFVLLIQLDVWESIVFSHPAASVVTICNVDPEEVYEDEFRGTSHYNLRSVFSAFPSFLSIVFENTPLRTRIAEKFDLPVHISLNHHRTHAICCVYLI